MKVITAYLLAVLGSNTSPSAEDLTKLLGSVGVDAEEEQIELLMSQVKGNDITELIACGREKLASVPAGGGAVVVAAPTGGAGGGEPTAAAIHPGWTVIWNEEVANHRQGTLMAAIRGYLHRFY
ncbi:60S acidic ribosomal protein p2 [Phtheirospermum japonicum]|uniref:60S acidic ribosomal protein p2 n=1 Tax=Phtheirospermum japonicum TaxID=374723 RepID=A0A830BBM9_9LAMI|nr:60S acidic ribosomal protein p2 [Phtheirospermum japonicum]